MENTIWPLKVSKCEPRNWKWSFWDQIIQIHKMRVFTPDRLKAIADEKGYLEEWLLFYYHTYEYREQILLAVNFE